MSFKLAVAVLLLASPVFTLAAFPGPVRQTTVPIHASSVTCTKTVDGTCVSFVCSDNTRYNSCDMCALPKKRPAPLKAMPKNALKKITISKKVSTESNIPKSLLGGLSTGNSSSKEKGIPYTCNDAIKDGGCFFVYCGKEKKTDLLTVACPALGYGASFYNGTTCSFTAIEYASSSNPQGTCLRQCDSKKTETVDCPHWMHVPSAPKKTGPNDQYCKEHPEDTFICNPSAG